MQRKKKAKAEKGTKMQSQRKVRSQSQKIVPSQSQKIGLPPGSLVYIGEKKRDSTRITLVDYCEDSSSEVEIFSDDFSMLKNNKSSIQWINVEGLHEIDILEKVGECFGLHALVLEDILNTEQRPKVEEYQGYMYVVVKMLFYDAQLNEFDTEQVSIVLGDNFVISFGERDTDLFNPISDRIKQGISRIRKMGPDYLVYSLLDIIIDNYFSVLEDLGDKIEATEDKMLIKPSPNTLQEIHQLKRQVLFLHKAVWPLRDVLSTLERGENPFIKETTDIYLRDLYDHVIQVMDTADTLRDIIASMLDIYLTSSSNKMNEIMKVLTIISTVFMPLSFIVGVYGMNFDVMPELRLPWMYPTLWLIMISISGIMLYYFKKKKWW